MTTHFTKTELTQLLDNGKGDNHGKDHTPVARFFLNGVNGTLLVTEILPGEKGLAYGLYTVGGESKVTQFSLGSIAEELERHGFGMKRDEKFKPQYTLSVYTKAANRRHAVEAIKDVLNKNGTPG